MCFRVKTKRAKIAKKNIVCYKVSNTNKELKTPKTFRPFFEESFEYFPNRKTDIVNLMIDYDGDISEGYHSFRTLENSWLMYERENYKIGKFIIPKGAEYYENDTEYVSETLIFKGYIK